MEANRRAKSGGKGGIFVTLAVLVVVFVPVGTAYCRTITVRADGSGDYPTIQAAINDANDGDEVVVADGTYTGDGNRDIVLRGEKITVKSENGPSNCIIDCNGGGWDFHGGFNIRFCENSETVIDGFTIINGYQTRQAGGGGAFSIADSNCLITNCWLFNHKGINGGAILCARSNARIINCIIAYNSAWKGSGIFCTNSSTGWTPGPRNGGPEISNCLFVGNIARMGGFAQVGTIFCYNSDTIIRSCTLVDNNYGIFVLLGDVEINNCILQNVNYEIETPNWYWPTVNVGNCLIRGFKIREGDNSTIIILDGNIDADPCFVDPNNDDFRLWPGSPCIDAGDPNYAAEPSETDLDGNPRVADGDGDGNSVVDIGAYEFFCNTVPVACVMGGDRVVEAGVECEVRVVLDGSCSSDEDSTEGTNDDINDFDWCEVIDACEPNSDIYLGSGEVIECNLGLGEHLIILEVTDKAGAFDSNEVVITVVDVTPPELSLTIEPNVLWPPNGKMVQVRPEWEVSDNCDEEVEVSLVDISMSTAGDVNDYAQMGDDGSIYLRAAKSKRGGGRIYTLTYEAVDESGNVTQESTTVTVPHSRGPRKLLRRSRESLRGKLGRQVYRGRLQRR